MVDPPPRWRGMGWGLYLWCSIVVVVVSFLNVVRSEDNIFDMIIKATSDKILLVSFTHLCVLVIGAIIYFFVRMSLGEIRETERENIIDRCRSLILDWLIFLVFARPNYNGKQASVMRLSFGFIYLLAMRVLHHLLKLRTAALADYRPNMKGMLRIIATSAGVALINFVVAMHCLEFFEELNRGIPRSNPLPFLHASSECLGAMARWFSSDYYAHFCHAYVYEPLAQVLVSYDYPLIRPLVIVGFFAINTIRLICPQMFFRLIQTLSDHKFGAVSWIAFESIQITFEAAFTTLKGLMYLFDHELQSRVHRTWRDLTIMNIMSDLILDLMSSALSSMWIISLIIAGTSRSVLGVPIFLLTDMVQNIIGVYNSVLSLYRYWAMEAFLSKFPKATLDQIENQDTCIVCRETLYLNSGDPVRLGCSHVFHYACLKNWYTQQQSCPTCRTTIDPTMPTETTSERNVAQVPGSHDRTTSLVGEVVHETAESTEVENKPKLETNVELSTPGGSGEWIIHDAAHSPPSVPVEKKTISPSHAIPTDSPTASPIRVVTFAVAGHPTISMEGVVTEVKSLVQGFEASVARLDELERRLNGVLSKMLAECQ